MELIAFIVFELYASCLKDGGNCAPADDNGVCMEGKKCDYFRDNYDYDWGTNMVDGHHNSTGYNYSNDQMYDNWMPNYNNAYEIIMYSDDSCGEEDDSFSTYMQSDFQSSCDYDWDLQQSLQHTCLVQGTQTSYEIKMSADIKCGGKSNINCLVFSFAFLVGSHSKNDSFLLLLPPPAFN